jgi:hypothetical protein
MQYLTDPDMIYVHNYTDKSTKFCGMGDYEATAQFEIAFHGFQ